MKRILNICIAAAVTAALAGCTKDAFDKGFAGEAPSDSGRAEYSLDGMSDIGGGSGEGGNGGSSEGVLTAGEWNDLANWDFWGNLMTLKDIQSDTPAEGEQDFQAQKDYGKMASMWGFNTARRVAVRVKDGNGNPAVNAKVELKSDGSTIWTTRTDNEGKAELWKDLFAEPGQETGTGGLQVSIAGVLQAGEAKVSTFTGGAVLNEYVATVAAPEKKADIAFIVDATGSMGDEISFLKDDLMSILEKLQQSQSGVALRTGAVFYRDKGDEYVTKAQDFTSPDKLIQYIKKQHADGGGDTPEAVHSALETALQKLSWNGNARSRIAFLILDAPAHEDHEGVVKSLRNSIQSFAEQGIRIIPILASSYDKTTEFMCRDFAIVTNGTYVFLTDDSGVGNSHIVPSVGDYEVEKLNDLMLRLLEAYIK